MVPRHPTGDVRASKGVDESLLAMEPGSIARYANLAELQRRYEPTIAHIEGALAPHMPSAGPLLRVAATYAALTLRLDYLHDDRALAYPLFLLSGWVWDDLVDTNKGSGGAQRAMHEGLARLTEAARVGTFAPAPVTLGRYRSPVRAAATLTARVQQITSEHLPSYADRIGRETIRFVASFLKKVELRHDHRDLDSFVKARTVCVGMQPSYEISYAFVATAASVDPEAQCSYLERAEVQPCADLATLHCAAVNDLFSMYKDRFHEDTANFPSVLGGASTLDDYHTGAERTVAYLRRVYRQFIAQCALLPDLPGRDTVTRTWHHMMEGNLLYHLMVPRYREGVGVVADLLNPALTAPERRNRFYTMFTEGPVAVVERTEPLAEAGAHKPSGDTN